MSLMEYFSVSHWKNVYAHWREALKEADWDIVRPLIVPAIAGVVVFALLFDSYVVTLSGLLPSWVIPIIIFIICADVFESLLVDKGFQMRLSELNVLRMEDKEYEALTAALKKAEKSLSAKIQLVRWLARPTTTKYWLIGVLSVVVAWYVPFIRNFAGSLAGVFLLLGVLAYFFPKLQELIEWAARWASYLLWGGFIVLFFFLEKRGVAACIVLLSVVGLEFFATQLSSIIARFPEFVTRPLFGENLARLEAIRHAVSKGSIVLPIIEYRLKLVWAKLAGGLVLLVLHYRYLHEKVTTLPGLSGLRGGKKTATTLQQVAVVAKGEVNPEKERAKQVLLEFGRQTSHLNYIRRMVNELEINVANRDEVVAALKEHILNTKSVAALDYVIKEVIEMLVDDTIAKFAAKGMQMPDMAQRLAMEKQLGEDIKRHKEGALIELFKRIHG